MPYKVKVHYASGNKDVAVNGRKVRMHGFEEFEFFVHRTWDENPNIPERNKGWTISEATTGQSVAKAFFQKDVRTLALEKLNRVGIDRFRDMLGQIIAKYGRVA